MRRTPIYVLERAAGQEAVVNVVVTGGAGFLGSRLARELLAAGSIEEAGTAARPLSRVTLIDQSPPPADLAAAEQVTA
ncbi:MAG TPA: NAD-dependent epimerase/dehydratase family protein, partial [Streptosporangiaceae bacterium]|nr:NAD-dependent epimerase/dehydratase family protein [Streptosporangiaceae bacterium]